MDRIQPPPNYYGAPYPSSGETQSYRPPFQDPYQMPGTNVYPRADNDMMPSNNNNYNNGNNYNNPNNNGNMNNNNNNMNNGNYGGNYTQNTDIVHPFFGRKIKVYCSFPDSAKWHDVVFEGVMVEQSNDHIVIEDRDNGKSYLIVAVYVNYLELDGVNKMR